MNLIIYHDSNLTTKKVAQNLFNTKDFFTNIIAINDLKAEDIKDSNNIVYIYSYNDIDCLNNLEIINNKNILLVEINKDEPLKKDEIISKIASNNNYLNTYIFKNDNLVKENKVLYKHITLSLVNYVKEDTKPLTKKRLALNMILLISFIVALGLILLGSIFISKIGISPRSVFRVLFKPDGTGISNIIWYDRLPRIIGGALIGAILALAGVVLKVVMRNDLAAPSIIGVNAGASLAAHICILAFPALAWFLPFGAFIGSFLTTVLIYFMAYKKGASPARLVLAGVAITSIYGAFTSLIRMLNADSLGRLVGFGIGHLKGVSIKTDVPLLFFVFIISFLLLMIFSKRINIMMLGDEMATALGLRVELFRWFLIIISSLLASISIAIAGMIGFVGLIVPHIARLIVGSDHRFLIPTSAVLGSILLVVSDTIGRIVLPQGELYVGVILAFVGAPFFLFLLRRSHAG